MFSALVVGLALAVPVVAGVLALHSQLRLPRRSHGPLPQRLRAAAREVSLPTAGGRRLFGWYFPPRHPPSAGMVLLHGWGDNAASLLSLVAPLSAAGVGLLAIDARNHGRSDSDGRASLLQFAADLDRALDWLGARPDIDRRRLFALGHSIGAAAALLTGSRRPDLAGVVSIGCFAHSTWQLRRQLGRTVPYWPIGWALVRYREWRLGVEFDHIAPCNVIGRLQRPVLLVHAADDATVPVADASAILARRAGDQVRLLILPRGGHRPFRQLARQQAVLADFVAAASPRDAES